MPGATRRTTEPTMTTRTIPILLLALAACGPTLDPVAPDAAARAGSATSELVADGFALLGTKDGVTLLSRRRAAGLELAAEGELPASPERIERVLLDYPAHKSWQGHLAQCKVVAQGPDWLDVYERLSLPINGA